MISFGVYLERLRRQLIRIGHQMPVIEDLSEDGLFRYAKMLEEVFMLVEPDDFFLEMRKRFFEEFVGGSESSEGGTLNEESDDFSGFDDGFSGGSEGSYQSKESVRGDLGGFNFLGLAEIGTDAYTDDEYTSNGRSSGVEAQEDTLESQEDITKRWMGYLQRTNGEDADGFSSAFDEVEEVNESTDWGTLGEGEQSGWGSDDLNAPSGWSDDDEDAQDDWGTSDDEMVEPSSWGSDDEYDEPSSWGSDEDENSGWISDDLDDTGGWSDDDSEGIEPSSWGTEDEYTDEDPSGWGSDDEDEPDCWGTEDEDADEEQPDWGNSKEESDDDGVFNVSGLLDDIETSDSTKMDAKYPQETEKEEIVTEKTSIQRSNATIKMLSGLFGRKK